MGTIKVIKKWNLKSNPWNNKVNDEDKKGLYLSLNMVLLDMMKVVKLIIFY